MIDRRITALMVEMEQFIDRLLSHSREKNCTHTITDLLCEFFDNKEGISLTTGHTQDKQQPDLPNQKELSK